MPPLCTAGYGLATGHLLYFLGAFYLFFINTVFIALATYCGVRLMHFNQHEFQSPEMAVKAKRIVMAIVVVTMLPAVYMTVGIVQQSISENNVRKFIKTELTQRGTQIISNSVERDSLKLRVVAVGREITEAKRAEAERRMAQYGMIGYRLRVIQGTQSDSLLALSDRLSTLADSREQERRNLLELSAENAQLIRQLSEYARYEALAADIRPEMATLFPQVSAFSLARVTEVSRDSMPTRSYVAAIIQGDDKSLSQIDGQKLHDWLRTRIKADSIVVIKKD